MENAILHNLIKFKPFDKDNKTDDINIKTDDINIEDNKTDDVQKEESSIKDTNEKEIKDTEEKEIKDTEEKEIKDTDKKDIKDTEEKENKDTEEKEINLIVKEEVKESDLIPHITSKYDTLVLSGGGIKGFITLGALHYADLNFFLKDIKTYIGTSTGSLICYLLAIGYNALEIMAYLSTSQILNKLRNFNVLAIINGGGASSFHPIHEQLEKMTIEKIGSLLTLKGLYDNFGKTLVCVTYNLTKNKTEYLSHVNYPDLPCLIALRMSSNLPLIFDHFKYMNCHFIDGGICDNFAISLGEKYGEKILGIYVNATKSDIDIDHSEKGLLEYIYKLLFIPIKQSSNFQIQSVCEEKCSVINLISDIDIKIFDFGLRTSEKLDMFSSGYNQIKHFFEQL